MSLYSFQSRTTSLGAEKSPFGAEEDSDSEDAADMDDDSKFYEDIVILKLVLFF